MKKKLIAGILAFVLAFGALPAVNAPAAVSSLAAESDAWTDDGAISEKPAAGVVTLKQNPADMIGKDWNGHWETGIPKKSAAELAALKKLIAKAKKQGASVEEDVDNPNVYTWEKGKLVKMSMGGLSGAWNFSSLKNLKTLSVDSGEKNLSLDVSGCTKLEYLDCRGTKYGNNLSKLDVSGCKKLKTLYCGKNKLSKLDVSGCTKLEYLDCSNNNLSKLDVSKCKKLGDLNCKKNKLSRLYLSKSTGMWAEMDAGVTIIRK